MKKNYLHECPVCGNHLRITSYECSECRTRIEGNFHQAEHRFSHLTPEEMNFIEQFVRVRGSIKEMEKVLGVSYPTVRGKLNTVIEHLGYPVEKEQISPDLKREILDKLEKGEISAGDAARLLKGEELRNENT